MKQRTKFILIGAILFLIALVLCLLPQAQIIFHSQPVGKEPRPQDNVAPDRSSSGQEVQKQREKVVENILNVLGTPISFYGKVIDQNGDPVAHADVQYGVIDTFDAKGSKYAGKSDNDGFFAISGIKGAVLTVGVWKAGYYNINDKSDGAFAYGVGADTSRREPPTKTNPAVFVLQKEGEKVALLHGNGGQIDVPKKGEPLAIDLETAQPGKGHLRIASWIGNDAVLPFDWCYQLSIPDGGIIERKSEFDFQAPEDGYQPAVEINMPATAEQWSARAGKDFFVKLADGRYARFSIRFYPGDRNFVVLESFLNPIPGDRNLEFDPNKAVSPN